MISSGSADFDEVLDGGFHSGGLILIIGPPASGKTRYLRYVLQQALRQHIHTFLVDHEGVLGKELHTSADRRYFGFDFQFDPEHTKLDLGLYAVDGLAYQVRPGFQDPLIPWLTDSKHVGKMIRIATYTALRNDIGLNGPRALTHAADVVIVLDHPEPSVLLTTLVKNRYGSCGLQREMKFPEIESIVRPTLWERLNLGDPLGGRE